MRWRSEPKTRNTILHTQYDGATQVTSHKYGAVATTHVFVFDKARKLKYQGRIDDNEHVGLEKVHNLTDAVDAMLANKTGRSDYD